MKFPKREIPKGDGNGGVFLKLKDGESKVGVLRGEIFEFFQVWEGGKSRVVEPDAPGAKSRFRVNFVTKEGSDYKAKILDFGLIVYGQLAEIAEEWDIDKTGIKISRRGSGTDTVYVITPSKDQPNAQAMKAISAVDLNILEPKPQAEEPKVKNYAPGADDTEKWT
jgi:hypothetical protein